MKRVPLWCVAVAACAFFWHASNAEDPVQIAYPEGYRGWTHVKSSVIGPQHKNYSFAGGFRHIYANPQAMEGYRTRQFPEGSIIVSDAFELGEEEGLFFEGSRRQVDLMVKDTERFAATGGWGFERFTRENNAWRALSPGPEQCFACHDRLQKDGLVLSKYRP